MAPASPLAPTTATEVLETGRTPFDVCYARARGVNPALGRTSIELAFAIDPAGKPITVDLQYKHGLDDAAKECMRNAALALIFPSSMQGRQTGKLTFKPAAPTAP